MSSRRDADLSRGRACEGGKGDALLKDTALASVHQQKKSMMSLLERFTSYFFFVHGLHEQ